MRKSVAVFWVLVLFSCVSCSLPVLHYGSASAEFALTGAISPTAFVKAGTGKAVSPATAVVEVTVSGSEGILRTVSVSLMPGETMVRIPNLPSGSALSFEILTRNIRGDVITKATVTGVSLAPGVNRLSAVLKPDTAAVAVSTISAAMGAEAPYVAASSLPIDYNETKFFSIEFPDTYTGERHIVFDTGTNSGYYPSVLIDGLVLERRQLNSMGTSYAVMASNGTNLRVYRCSFNGNSNASSVASGYPAKSAAVLFQGTRLEIGLSKLIGGYAATSAMVTADSYGLEVTGANTPTVIVHTSSIAGGYAYTPGTSSTATTRGLSCIAPNAKLAVFRSKLLGGWASGGTSASSTGLYITSAAAPYGMLVASSQVSGGFAENGSSTLVYGIRALSISSYIYYVFGNVIDSGDPSATSGTRSACSVRLEGLPSATKSYASGNLFISTANNDGGQAPLDSNTAGFSENNNDFSGNRISAAAANVFIAGTGFAAVPRYVGSPYNNVSLGYYSISDAGTLDYAVAFGKFSAFGSTGTFDARLKAWLDGNEWKLTSTMVSLTDNLTAIVPFASIQADFPDAYPLLMLDLAGFRRPESGAWRIGAFE